jgi:translocation and assembly module TamA
MLARRNYKGTRLLRLLGPLLFATFLVLGAAWMARVAWSADAHPVDVTVEGVSGEAHKNVLATLSIAHPPTKTVNETEARQLHLRAPNEIELALQPYGYYRAAVWSEIDLEGGRWRAHYRIDPGEPMRVDSLIFRLSGEGRVDPAFQAVLADPPLHHGDVLLHAAYDDFRERLTTAAMKNGYIDAHFLRHEIRVDVERNVAAIVVEYDTGPHYVFGPVTFQQSVVDPDLVEGYVTFRRGQPADYSKLLELEQSLDNSPYWSRVEVRPRRDLARGSELPIVVTLTPAKQEKYTLGAGYGTDNGPHGRGVVELRRLNRRGHRATLEGTLSSIEHSAALKYQVPWPYPRTDVLTLTTGYSEVLTQTSDARTSLIGASLARIWAGWQEAFTLQYRRENWSVGIDSDHSGFLVPEASWSRLRADDPIDPGDGSRLRFRVSGAHESVYSATSYFRLEGLARWLRAFTKQHRLIGRLEAGETWNSDFHALPPSVRFFAGGAQSVRGYAYNRLGPRDAGGFVSGGDVLLVGSVEYEFRFMPKWGVAGFYDVGNAMRKFSDPLASGAGGGLRWVSPIGMVRTDVGFPLNTSSRVVQFHVSIGPNL